MQNKVTNDDRGKNLYTLIEHYPIWTTEKKYTGRDKLTSVRNGGILLRVVVFLPVVS